MLVTDMQSNYYSEKTKCSGFTLLEVMVALAVLALGLGTVMKVTGNQPVQLAHLKNKTIAQWVASNKSNEVQLSTWPRVGSSNGREFMAGEEWFWKLTVSKTADKDIRRLDIEVNQADAEGEPLVRFIAFKGKPAVKAKTP